MAAVALALLQMLVLSAGAAWGSERGADGKFDHRSSAHFELYQDVAIDRSSGFHGSRRFEQQVLAELERAYDSLDQLLGLRPNRRIEVVIYDAGVFDHAPGSVGEAVAVVVNAVTDLDRFGMNVRVESGSWAIVVGSVSGVSGGTIAGRSTAQDFIDANAMNVWPSSDSPLRGAANSDYAPSNDFNRTLRTGPMDAGAYEADSDATNPGWSVQAAFKDFGLADTMPPAAPTLVLID